MDRGPLVDDSGGALMPIVRIEMLSGRSVAAKEALAARITAVFEEVWGTDPEVLDIVFVPVERADWFRGGQSYAARLAAAERPVPKDQL